MMSLGAIESLRGEQGAKAQQAGLEPKYLGTDCRAKPEWVRDIPNLGDYVPKGWELDADADDDGLAFVDKAGNGDGGRSMSLADLIEWLRPGYGYGIVEEGMFQLYVGRFKRIEAIPIVNADVVKEWADITRRVEL